MADGDCDALFVSERGIVKNRTFRVLVFPFRQSSLMKNGGKIGFLLLEAGRDTLLIRKD